MKSKVHKLTVSFVVATALTLAMQQAFADHEKGLSGLSANDFIGKEVKNAQNEHLGKVQDIILTMDSGSVTVPYVVIAHGGALGVGRTKTAVPMEALQCSGDGKTVTISATKEELRAASRNATGRWAAVKESEWTRSVDGFYDPAAPTSERTIASERTERQRYADSTEKRLLVRDPAPKGAELLMTPADRALCEKVCEAIDNVQVSVNNGIVTIHGQVDSEATRQNIESRVKAVSGVQKVESHLKVRTP